MPWWTITFWTILLLVCVAAWRLGGRHEREAASLLLLAAISTVLVRSSAAGRYSSVEVGVLAVDAALICGLVVVAVRSGRWWSIALAVLQGITLLGHLGKFLDPGLWRLGYAIMITGPAFPGLIILLIGIIQGRGAATSQSNTTSSRPSSRVFRA
ncbi:hypothetical protein [uncultured Sphingomonas sp.]|uniref:hypothetical protein n=1 Tax=uncultured Sphingomonas sp. TaxID=158754 RepID=UPI0025F0B062|nr:hypothetical protein [uncultured Sphingomonas sp.]